MKKQTIISKLFLAIFIAVITLGACTKEEPEPEPVDIRDQYIGSYSMKEECGTNDDEYTISISKVGFGKEVEVFNLYNAGKRSTAFVRTNGELDLNNTNVGEYGNCDVGITNASGMMNANKLTIVFDIEDVGVNFGCNPFSFSCIAVGYK
ncbi:MAG: hypothetical protein R2830_26675 [Saprospiraceae bacterium]